MALHGTVIPFIPTSLRMGTRRLFVFMLMVWVMVKILTCQHSSTS